MTRLSLWNIRKDKDYEFFDKTLSDMFYVGGVGVLVHKYIGPQPQGGSDDLTQPDVPDPLETTIQDLLLLENRDRKYDKNVYELRGVYNAQDNDFDLSQFGLFLSADNLFFAFHINDMIDIMGRKIMSGDVLELPNLRDDTLLSQDPDQQFGPVIPKLYKVDDTGRDAQGFSSTWYPHTWRVRISPLSDSQEYRDILDQAANSFGDPTAGGEDNSVGTNDAGQTLRDLISTFPDELEISNSIIAEAERQVPNRNLEHAHLYVSEQNENGIPYLFMTDAEPPNGATLLGSGNEFPAMPADGSWFLRTDYSPNVLYKREGPRWVRKEADYKEKWTTANRTLCKFISNTGKVGTQNRGIIDSKQGIKELLSPLNRSKIKPEDKS